MIMAVCPLVSPRVLNFPISLTVGLRVITGSETNGNIELLKEGLTYKGNELGASVQHDVIRYPEVADDMVEGGFGSFEGCG